VTDQKQDVGGILDFGPSILDRFFEAAPHAPPLAASAFASGYGGQVGASNDG
jgi:hypothetical protein